MNLQNKKTGLLGCITSVDPEKITVWGGGNDSEYSEYTTLSGLCEEWQDYEEPIKYWYLDDNGDVFSCIADDEFDKPAKEIGNYFETREDAEKAVEKLKAWKRLSENKYLFGRLVDLVYSLNANSREFDEYMDDILLLFGGEE